MLFFMRSISEYMFFIYTIYFGNLNSYNINMMIDENDDMIKVDFGESASSEFDELKTRYAYLAADFDNYKKRMSRERTELINSASRDILTDLLPVIDDFDRVLSVKMPPKLDQGIRMIYDKLMHVLDSEGCELIPCDPGDAFDVNLHNAVAVDDSDEIESGKISRIMQRGYKLNGKVLRPVMVSVVR